MMFDEGVPAVFAGTMVHGEPIADMSGTMQKYVEAQTESLKADAIRFFFGRNTETSRDDSHGKPSG